MIDMRRVIDGMELGWDGQRRRRKEILRSRRCFTRLASSLFRFAATSCFELVTVKAAAKCVEFELGEEGFQRIIVVRLDDKTADFPVIRRIMEDGGQLLRK